MKFPYWRSFVGFVLACIVATNYVNACFLGNVRDRVSRLEERLADMDLKSKQEGHAENARNANVRDILEEVKQLAFDLRGRL